MGLRERLNRHQGVSILASLSVVALVVLWSYMRTSEPSIPKQLSFYTADDGATLFSDESKKVPPFDHDGTQAVRTVVFTCDGRNQKFVQYLQKYSGEAKRQLEAPHSFGLIVIGLVKRPGDGKWISESDPKAAAIERPKCPDGSDARPVYP